MKKIRNLFAIAIAILVCQDHRLSGQSIDGEPMDPMNTTESSADPMILEGIAQIPIDIARYEAWHRIKRDFPLDSMRCDIDGIKSNDWMCCRQQIITDLRNPQYTDIQEECIEKIKKDIPNDTSDKVLECNHHIVTLSHLICLNECIFRSLKIVDTSGDVIPSLLKHHVESVMCTTEWQKSISVNVIDECLSEIKNHQHQHRHPQQQHQQQQTIINQCNASAFRITICLLRKFNDQCPFDQKCTQSNRKSYQTSSDDESQSDEQTKMDFVASRIPSRDHIIFSFD